MSLWRGREVELGKKSNKGWERRESDTRGRRTDRQTDEEGEDFGPQHQGSLRKKGRQVIREGRETLRRAKEETDTRGRQTDRRTES